MTFRSLIIRIRGQFLSCVMTSKRIPIMSFFFWNTENWYLYRLWSGFIPLSARDWRGFHVLGYDVVYRLVHYLRQRQVVFSSIYHVLYINVEYKHVLKCIYKKNPKKYQHTENYIKVKPMLKIKKKKMMQYTLSSYIVKLWATSTLEKC